MPRVQVVLALAAASLIASNPLDGVPTDVLTKLAASGKLEDHSLGESTIAPDGKSGSISLTSNAPPTQWVPKFQLTSNDLRRKVAEEPLVLVFFFSSNDLSLSSSHELAVKFEEAATILLEGEHQLPCHLVDFSKDSAVLAEDYGLSDSKMPAFKVFKDGRVFDYTGPRTTEGFIDYMEARAGPPYKKLKAAADLDTLLASMQETVVVGVFGGSSSRLAREAFVQNAEWLRDSLRYVELSIDEANQAAPFAATRPFESMQSAYAVVLPARWTGKNEPAYSLSKDFKTMHKFVPAHATPLIAPLDNELVSRSVKQNKLIAALVFDTNELANRWRYIHKQLHKLLAAEPSLTSSFVFTIVDRVRFPAYLASRFERSTYKGKFAGEFETEAKDFMLLVSNHSSSLNYVSDALVGMRADALETTQLAPFLQRVIDLKEPPLIQGDDAPAAAGLKTMSLGFDGSQTIEPDKPAKRGGKKRKKRKSKTGKEEL